MSKLNYDELVHKSYYFRNNPTYYEQVAISKLQQRKRNYYQFQVAFGWYILDFIIPSKMLVVELDGATHLYREKHDATRDKFCNECGLRVLRIPNENASRILEYIDKYTDMQDFEKRMRQAIRIAKDRRITHEKAKIEYMLRPVTYDNKPKKKK